MKRLSARLFMAGVVFALPVVGFSQTLSEALPELLATHERIKAAKADLEAAKLGIREAQAAWYPSMDVTMDAGTEKQIKPDAANTNTSRNKAELKLTQLIADFGKTGSSIDTARLSYAIAQAKLAKTEQDIILDGVGAYLNLIRAVERLRYARQSEENIQRQTGMEEARVKLGSGYATDVLQTKSQLAGAQAARVLAAGALVNAVNRYRAVFKKEIADVSAFRKPRIPLERLAKSLDDSIAIALETNLDLKIAHYQISSAREDIRSNKSAFFPKLELIAEAKRKHDDAGTLGVKEEYLAMVQLTYPLFAGGGDKAALDASRYGLTAAESRLDDSRRNVEEDVRNGWQNLSTSRANAEFLRNQANISGEFLALARKERRLGKRSLLDVLNGETNYINSISSAVSAETDMALSVFSLLHDMGVLNMAVFTEPAAGERPEAEPMPQSE